MHEVATSHIVRLIMKAIFLGFTSILFFAIAPMGEIAAQLVLDDSGSVGIGTTPPSADFEVGARNPEVARTVTGAKLYGARSVFVSGRYAYVTVSEYGNRLTVVDISDPTHPAVAGSVADADLEGPGSLYVSGRYAYVPAYFTDRLAVVDISNPSKPVVVGGVTDTVLDGARSVYVSGRYAYVAAADADRLTVVDVSDPANPAIAGSVTGTDLDYAWSVSVSGRYAYVAASNADCLTVVDVSDAGNPFVVGSATDIDMNGPQSVSVSGRYAYAAACYANTLTVLDISGIDSPSANIGSLAAGTIETSESIHSAGDIVADGGVNVGTGGIKSDGPVSVADLLNLAPRDSAPDFAVDGDIYFGSDGNLHLFMGSGWNSINMTSDSSKKNANR